MRPSFSRHVFCEEVQHVSSFVDCQLLCSFDGGGKDALWATAASLRKGPWPSIPCQGPGAGCVVFPVKAWYFQLWSKLLAVPLTSLTRIWPWSCTPMPRLNCEVPQSSHLDSTFLGEKPTPERQPERQRFVGSCFFFFSSIWFNLSFFFVFSKLMRSSG